MWFPAVSIQVMEDCYHVLFFGINEAVLWTVSSKTSFSRFMINLLSIFCRHSANIVIKTACETWYNNLNTSWQKQKVAELLPTIIGTLNLFTWFLVFFIAFNIWDELHPFLLQLHFRKRLVIPEWKDFCKNL